MQFLTYFVFDGNRQVGKIDAASPDEATGVVSVANNIPIERLRAIAPIHPGGSVQIVAGEVVHYRKLVTDPAEIAAIDAKIAREKEERENMLDRSRLRQKMADLHRPDTGEKAGRFARGRRAVRRYRAQVWDRKMQTTAHLGIFDTQEEADAAKAAALQRMDMGLPARLD